MRKGYAGSSWGAENVLYLHLDGGSNIYFGTSLCATNYSLM